ncbi:MAG: alkaline phosphatase [Bacteroidales bacterium]
MLQGRKEYLSEASAIAVEYLTSGPAGFFLLIESSQIDWACHGNHADYLITEMQDFDRTIGRVLDFAQRDGNTLVIVTGDHETGGFSLSAKSEGEGENCYPDYSVIAPRFTSTDHSAALVPVFAFGPGAERFSGVYENTEIFHKITRLLGVD